MLLDLYSGAIEQVDLAIESIEANQLGQGAVHRTRAAAIVTAIRSGLDFQHGELPVTVDQLCDFVLFCLAEGDLKKMRSGRKVLSELLEGFRGIRTEAIRMETTGEIPSLPTESSVELTC